jgi:hypothetical protein
MKGINFSGNRNRPKVLSWDGGYDDNDHGSNNKKNGKKKNKNSSCSPKKASVVYALKKDAKRN